MTDQGLKQLLLSSRTAVIRFLMLRGSTADEAEDLVQELFLKLEGLRIGPIAEPRAYLYRMADNLLLDRRRSVARRSRREEEWTDARSGVDVEADDTPSVEDAMIAREQLDIVTNALSTLPPRTAEIFRRFRVDGERQKVIAADFGVSVSAIEKQLQHAYDVVLAAKKELDEEFEEARRLRGERDDHGA